ncbi:dephospho-CoA kinase [Striga asiatica]|uniref:Dephospho-CoA kinase n=1 Tax=Striga asiatica TaxID=4170 RepID=A0A5A7PBJ4_STRAF|nr:dephospho-CoA kinase [Striga asiatica]
MEGSHYEEVPGVTKEGSSSYWSWVENGNWTLCDLISLIDSPESSQLPRANILMTRKFVMLLILVLARLFCPSLAEEEFRGVKQKKTLMGRWHTMSNDSFIHEK